MKNESKSWWHVFLSWQIMALCMFFSNIPVSYAQSPDKITVAGCVKDAAGDFLIGATVQVKGISGGTITDIDGNYILKDVPRTATLVFSYVGMQNKEVPVNGKSTINVTLLDDALQLEQVVVIGYGSVKKSDVTGSVTSVKTEALKEIPANSDGIPCHASPVRGNRDFTVCTVRIRPESCPGIFRFLYHCRIHQRIIYGMLKFLYSVLCYPCVDREKAAYLRCGIPTAPALCHILGILLSTEDMACQHGSQKQKEGHTSAYAKYNSFHCMPHFFNF